MRATGPSLHQPEGTDMYAVVSSVANAENFTAEQAQGLRDRFGSQEGLEQHLFLVDRETGEGLAVVLFRDRAALEAMQQNQAQNIGEAERISGAEVATTRNYEVL